MNNLCCVADVVDLFVEIRPGFNGGLPAASVVFFSHFGTRLAALQLQETIVRVRLGVRTANRVEFHVAHAVAAGEIESRTGQTAGDRYLVNVLPAVLGLQFASVAVNLAVGAADGADLVFTAGDVARLGGGAVMQSHRHDVLSARSPLHLAHRSVDVAIGSAERRRRFQRTALRTFAAAAAVRCRRKAFADVSQLSASRARRQLQVTCGIVSASVRSADVVGVG